MIDLGHVSAPVVAPWPSAHRRLSRSWLSALLAVGTLLLMGGAASGRDDPLPFVTSLPTGPYALLTIYGTTAFALDTADGSARIRAYGLPGGRIRWTARVPGNSSARQIFVRGSTAVVDTEATVGDAHTIAGFDTATGRERWHMAVNDTAIIGPALFVWPSNDNGLVGGPSTFERIDPVTGRIEWTATIGEACQTVFADSGDVLAAGLAELCVNGYDLSVLDLATGRIRAHRVLDIGSSLSYGSILVRNGVVVLANDQVRDIDISAYRVSDLTQLWSTPVEEGSALQGGCTLDVCVETPHGIVTLDLRAGTVVPSAGTSGTSTIALHPRPGILEFVIVPAAEMTGTMAVPIDVQVASMMPPGEAIDPGGYAPGNGTTTWIAQQLGDGSYRPLGALHGVGAACTFAASYVICATAPNQVSLWRLPVIA